MSKGVGKLWAGVGIVVLGVSMMASAGQATEVKLSSHVDTITIKGDFRLRQENFMKFTPGQTDRSRQRFRLRLGSDFVLPQGFGGHFHLASGTGEQVSTNQSFDNLSSQKEIWIDLAYLDWKPNSAWTISAGRMKNPFWQVYSSDIVWDSDYNPEGAAQQWQGFFGDKKVFLNLLQMVADEDSGSNQDQWMLGEQVGTEFKLPNDSRIRTALAHYQWINENVGTFSQVGVNEGNRRTGAAPGTLQNRFAVLEWTTEWAAWIGKTPLSLQLTYINNMGSTLTPSENQGLQVGAIYGKASAANSWELGYFWKRAETDATVADVADSDFGDGGTNRVGHMLWWAYNPESWIQYKVKYFITEALNPALAPGADSINRLQLDMAVKF